jgi:hypothetical protein
MTSTGENTAEDDTAYGKLTNVRVSLETETAITITQVAQNLTGCLVDHGLSSDLPQIATITDALPDTIAFENARTPKEIMEWAAQFGGHDNALLARGVADFHAREATQDQNDYRTQGTSLH